VNAFPKNTQIDLLIYCLVIITFDYYNRNIHRISIILIYRSFQILARLNSTPVLSFAYPPSTAVIFLDMNNPECLEFKFEDLNDV